MIASFFRDTEEGQLENKVDDEILKTFSATLYAGVFIRTSYDPSWGRYGNTFWFQSEGLICYIDQISHHFYYMSLLLYPETRRKAQAELDRVFGWGRLPVFEDFKSLPYINVLVKEGLRWKPAAPPGIAHSLREDHVFDGKLFLPKLSLPETFGELAPANSISLKSWIFVRRAMLTDPKVWKQPCDFFSNGS